jgi:ankyrin repeat protein
MSDVLQAIYRGESDEAERLAEGRELDVFEAAALGRTERLRELLDDDASQANAWADDGFQPLGLASFFAHADAVQLLLERGAEVNSASRNQLQVMPLHSAAATSDPEARYEIAKLLLDAGADPNAKQQDQYTPLMAADAHGDARLRELLVERGATS